jgi:hypothetical protein
MKRLGFVISALLALSFCYPNIVEAKEKIVRRKRRTFNLTASMNDISETWKGIVDPVKPVSDSLNCDQAIDELLLRLPDFGSVFYGLLNGWYIGQWADYSSCLADASDS